MHATRRDHDRRCRRAASASGTMPGTGRIEPSRPSSPTKARPSTASAGTAADATSTPTAIGRSSPAPPLRTPLGARFTVIRRWATSSPLDSSAARTRSRDSRQASSGRPTIVKPGQAVGDVDLHGDRATSGAEQRGRRDGGEHGDLQHERQTWWRPEPRAPRSATGNVAEGCATVGQSTGTRARAAGGRGPPPILAATPRCCGSLGSRPRTLRPAPRARPEEHDRGREPRAVERDPGPPRGSTLGRVHLRNTTGATVGSTGLVD